MPLSHPTDDVVHDLDAEVAVLACPEEIVDQGAALFILVRV